MSPVSYFHAREFSTSVVKTYSEYHCWSNLFQLIPGAEGYQGQKCDYSISCLKKAFLARRVSFRLDLMSISIKPLWESRQPASTEYEFLENFFEAAGIRRGEMIGMEWTISCNIPTTICLLTCGRGEKSKFAQPILCTDVVIYGSIGVQTTYDLKCWKAKQTSPVSVRMQLKGLIPIIGSN